jgi:arginase
VPVVLGGDHAMSLGSVTGVRRARRRSRRRALWIDAHADLNTPATSPSGNVHGMPLAHLLGHGDPRPDRRDLAGEHAAPRAGVRSPEDVVLVRQDCARSTPASAPSSATTASPRSR